MTVTDIIDECGKHNISISIFCDKKIIITVMRGDAWVSHILYADDLLDNSINHAVQMAIAEMIEELDVMK